MFIINFVYYHIMINVIYKNNYSKVQCIYIHTYIHTYIPLLSQLPSTFQLSLNIKLLVSFFIYSNFIAIDRYCLQVSCLLSFQASKNELMHIMNIKLQNNERFFFFHEYELSRQAHDNMTFGVTKKEANANLTIYNAFNPIVHTTFQKILSFSTNLVEFKSRSNIF